MLEQHPRCSLSSIASTQLPKPLEQHSNPCRHVTQRNWRPSLPLIRQFLHVRNNRSGKNLGILIFSHAFRISLVQLGFKLQTIIYSTELMLEYLKIRGNHVGTSDDTTPQNHHQTIYWLHWSLLYFLGSEVEMHRSITFPNHLKLKFLDWDSIPNTKPPAFWGRFQPQVLVPTRDIKPSFFSHQILEVELCSCPSWVNSEGILVVRT